MTALIISSIKNKILFVCQYCHVRLLRYRSKPSKAHQLNKRGQFKSVIDFLKRVENEVINIDELKDITKEFLTNNGDGSCDYCVGLADKNSSDNPKEAVVSLANDKLTSYAFYIKVQDEITKAYYELRSDYATNVLNTSSKELTSEELKQVKIAFPFILSEAEIKH